MGPDAMIFAFWMLSFNQIFHSLLSPSSKGSLVPLHFLPLVVIKHCLGLPFFGQRNGLEWKMTFSSPLATVEFSKFSGILSLALSQHQLSVFEIAQLESHHLHLLCSQWCFLRPTWLHIPGCLALGEWSHHRGYLGHSVIFCKVFVCILPTTSLSLLLLLLFLSFIVPIFACNVPLVSLIFLITIC